MKRRLGGVEWKKVGRLTALRCRRDGEKNEGVVCWDEDERGRPGWGDSDEINRRAKK